MTEHHGVDDDGIGDPVPKVFPPDDPAARFVFAMAMARNDIHTTLHDLLRSMKEDRQDFGYRVRLLMGHLFEATHALSRYREEFPEVRTLLSRTPPDAQAMLKTVVSVGQRAGGGELGFARDNTFHYPYPTTKYSPSSDEILRTIIAGMAGWGVSVHFDGDSREMTMTFASEAAVRLASGAPRPASEVHQLAVLTRDAALAFDGWFDLLIVAYGKSQGMEFGKPVGTPKKRD